MHDESSIESKNSIDIIEPLCQQRKNMEINNNEISSYLHEREDKSDNLIPSLQSENDKSNCAAKLNETSTCILMEAKVNEIIKSSHSGIDKTLNSINDNDECAKLLPNEHTIKSDEKLKTTLSLNESAKSVINNEKSDSEKLEAKEISSNDQKLLSIATGDDTKNNTLKMIQSQISDEGES